MLAELDRAKPGSDKAEGSLEQLRKALDLGPQAMAALLLLAERRNGDGADRASELARSTQTYHEILDALAAMEREEPTELVLLERAQTAMTEGRFDDAEAELRALKAHWIAGANPEPGSRLEAAKVEMLLGDLALMQREHEDAAAHFEAAREQIMMTSPVAAEPAQQPLPQLDRDWSQQIDWDALPSSAGPTRGPLVTVVVRPDPVASSLPPGMPKSNGAQLPFDVVGLLLRRADALFGIGDLAAARLLYSRAAAAGDARGATGAGKTFDPEILSQLGARGIKPDPAAAQAWYKLALALGDVSAAEHLDHLNRVISR